MNVPVFMYHHVLPKESFITSSVEQFEEQMRFLSQNGYKTITSEEFYNYKNKRIKLPEKSVMITFDDGWKDNLVYAYPILKKYNLKATLFIVTNWIEEASKKKGEFTAVNHGKCKTQIAIYPEKVVLNWDDIEKMSDVFDYHSHTHTHRDFYFKKCGWEEEFYLSKKSLKDRLGIDEKQLCWPRGFYDNDLLNLAKEYNYKMFYTTKRGMNRTDKKLDHIKRIAAKKDAKWMKKTLSIFSNNLAGTLYSLIKSS